MSFSILHMLSLLRSEIRHVYYITHSILYLCTTNQSASRTLCRRWIMDKHNRPWALSLAVMSTPVAFRFWTFCVIAFFPARSIRFAIFQFVSAQANCPIATHRRAGCLDMSQTLMDEESQLSESQELRQEDGMPRKKTQAPWWLRQVLARLACCEVAEYFLGMDTVCERWSDF